ncbi:MAG: ATPase [Bacteroidetes bacterium]|nr:MAG: ATPase [Bacteroidota bacterium]
MQSQNFQVTLLFDQSPKEVFDAVNNVRGWWSEEIEGGTNKLNDVFDYHYKEAHKSRMRIIEMIPNEKVVWFVEHNYFNFTNDDTEWTGSKISFDITKKDTKTELRFTHLGLIPRLECYDVCSNAWSEYLEDSLSGLVTAGRGKPNKKEAKKKDTKKS